jgi:alkylation response protein AidB-like acyl-CoA dehydrogenase
VALTAEQRDQQFKQAEELLFSGPQQLGFAKALYYGYFNADLVFPYPELKAEERERTEAKVKEVQEFADKHIDAALIDREARIPQEVIAGLGRIGMLGATVPTKYNGLGFSQYAYCKMLEIIGGADAGVGIFVNAHQSIGARALLLEGTEAQRDKWLPGLATGEQIAAFALTEPEAGSDAGNVQTTATPTEDGSGYLINGLKHYITNAAFSDILTLMARTPVPGKDKSEITAFLVEPKSPGFEFLIKNQPKCGVRGTWQARFQMTNVRVPKENILGKLGKGLKLALSVLNFGRTTFGATCTGAAKVCLRASARHANTRKQFDQTLGNFEMVKKKLAHMAAYIFAMEATTYQCASLIDRGFGDYMLETAILKVFASDCLWQIVNDCIQIYGGKAYFSDQPYERMMRDARINLIGEGANDVMRAFIAMYGLGNVGKSFESALLKYTTLVRLAGNRLSARIWKPEVPVSHMQLKPAANELSRRIQDFGLAVEKSLRKHQKLILERQYVQERLADTAIELYTSSCVLSKLEAMLNNPVRGMEKDVYIGRFYLKAANRRIKQKLAELWDNDDEAMTNTADLVLKEDQAQHGRPTA